MGSRARGFMVYTIKETETSSETTWNLKKRYKDFVKLDRDLSVHSVLLRQKLPPKGLIGFRHRYDLGNFNKDRQFALDSYLKTLVRQVAALEQVSVLQDFFLQDVATMTQVEDETGGSFVEQEDVPTKRSLSQ